MKYNKMRYAKKKERISNVKTEAEATVGSTRCASTSLTWDQSRITALLAILFYTSSSFFF